MMPGYARVFTVVFEVAAAKRVALDVEAWSEDDVASVFQGLIAYGLAYLVDQLRVPCRGETCAYRKSRSIISLGRPLAGGVDVYSRRTVGEDGRWYTVLLKAYCLSCRSLHKARLMSEHGTGAYEA